METRPLTAVVRVFEVSSAVRFVRPGSGRAGRCARNPGRQFSGVSREDVLQAIVDAAGRAYPGVYFDVVVREAFDPFDGRMITRVEARTAPRPLRPGRTAVRRGEIDPFRAMAADANVLLAELASDIEKAASVLQDPVRFPIDRRTRRERRLLEMLGR